MSEQLQLSEILRQAKELSQDEKTRLINELGGTPGQEMQMNETLQKARALSAENQAQLINSLLSGSGMSVVFGNGNVTTAEIVIQIQAIDPQKLDVSEILTALAERIRPKRAS